MRYLADLHIHSVLSPCADLLMVQENIFKKLKENNIKIFSITDHNSNGNSKVFQKRAEKEGILFIPGIEIATIEEIHILGYFKNLEDLKSVKEKIYKNLPDMKNREDIFGYQLLLDENDDFVEKEEAFLASATNIGIDEVFDIIKKNNGLAVPAHLDKTNSIISNLGYIPELEFDAFEIYIKEKVQKFKKKYSLGDKILSSSDAHFPHSIKKPKLEFDLKDLSINAFFEAFKKGNFKIIKGD
ncbi:MAG: PHP domain-containing protein [Fusobacteriota bacterium]